MGKPRRAYLHVGLDDGSGVVVDDALEAHAHALLALRVRRPVDSGATFRAVLDVLDAHEDWGYDRSEVDGAWAELVHGARRGRDTIVLSQPLLAAASPDRARAVVESLDGFDVHAVVTVKAPDAWVRPGDPGRDLAEVLPRWASAVGAADHVHVLLGKDAASTWKALGRVAAFGTTSLRVPTAATPPPFPADPRLAAAWRDLLGHSAYDVVGDTAVLDPEPFDDDGLTAAGRALGDAHHELERLRQRNDELTHRLAKAERKRRKLKRRLADLG
ncbi:hypothetical protein [Nocardioides sp.]|uniref:hypothetical protein n=1 Tax=Nocardioides sp. TaxID=35761 RepID=UPI0027234121|nr:hypothetical protein [Nocardioides sp.]MDO9454691.1 hypothetical protein [Nocardioides sp.]